MVYPHRPWPPVFLGKAFSQSQGKYLMTWDFTVTLYTVPFPWLQPGAQEWFCEWKGSLADIVTTAWKPSSSPNKANMHTGSRPRLLIVGIQDCKLPKVYQTRIILCNYDSENNYKNNSLSIMLTATDQTAKKSWRNPPKVIWEQCMANPHNRQCTCLLHMLAVQCPLHTSPVSPSWVNYIHTTSVPNLHPNPTYHTNPTTTAG